MNFLKTEYLKTTTQTPSVIQISQISAIQLIFQLQTISTLLETAQTKSKWTWGNYSPLVYMLKIIQEVLLLLGMRIASMSGASGSKQQTAVLSQTHTPQC